MTIWFGPFVDLRPDYGYFYLCPTCYGERVKPHLDHVQGRLAELHPLARHLGLHVDPAAEDSDTADTADTADDKDPPPDPAAGPPDDSVHAVAGGSQAQGKQSDAPGS